MIRILAIGKKHESWISDGLERYQKRLRPPFTVEWVLLPHSKREGLQAREEESEALLARIKPQDVVILLDERGGMFSSPELAASLQSYLQTGSLTLVIGGAYGVNQRMRERAVKSWSLSKLVFPHMLVRLLVVEQLYRAQEINTGGPYHHE